MRRSPLLLVILSMLSATGASPSPAATVRGFAWRDSIQARFDARAFAAAESLALRAIAESEADSGAATLSVGRLSRMLALARWRRGGASFDSLDAPFTRALTRLRTHSGDRTHEFADLLASQATVTASFERWDEAIAIARRALGVVESAHGAQDTLAIRPVTVLATLLARSGRTGEASGFYARVADLHELRRPANVLDAADSRADAALAATQAGDLERAAALLDRAESALAARVPEDHALRMRAASIRLSLLRRTGDLPGRQRVLDRLIVLEEAKPRPTPGLLRYLRERAHVRSDMADDRAALPDLERAAEVAMALHGGAHETTINTFSELAQFQDLAGQPALADSTFARALAGALQMEPTPGPRTAFVIAARGTRRYTRHDLVGARTDFEAAAKLHRAADPRALDVGVTLLELSRVLADLRRPDSASLVLGEARAVFQRHRSPLHPSFADADAQEAWAHALAGDPLRAWDLALASAQASARHLRLVTRGSSEREALRLLETRRYRLGLAQALASERARDASAAPRIAATWEATIAARGLVLEQIAERRHRQGLAVDPQRRTLDSLWDRASADYARRLVADPSGSDSLRRAQLEASRRALESAERAWANATGSAPDAASDTSHVLPALARRLRAGQALVSYALHGDVAGRSAAAMAFVLRADESAPRLVPLAAADTLSARVADWREALELRRAPTPAALALLERQAERAGEALRAAAWDPVARELGEAREVFVVPDGALQLVHLAALPDGRGGFLVESGPTFITLTRERDLLAPERAAPAARGLLAIGAPDFEARGGQRPRTPLAAAFRGATGTCARFRDLRFAALAATADELRDVAGRVGAGAEVLSGAAADEAAFKREAPRHRRLHVATHGFFLSDGCAAGDAGSLRGIGGLAPAATAAAAPSEPMRLSGLALAGANRRAEAGPDDEDGIVTAEEIAALDLRGVERVVLSACRTGVGDVLTGEGVTGLRRAFRVAGARTLVMSLWEVDDRAAADWMRSLYANDARGLDAAAAVRAACREQLVTRRAAGASVHPAYWGAFVAVGEGR